ncbi:MAG: hypothetical protein P8011_07990 [Acidihalobacter sp.]|jgi:hypothetical protein|uniref:hypothetical protein n=1 Tax=Acidihalobacter sp. TaxID=1872108 RepID=UPI00307FC664
MPRWIPAYVLTLLAGFWLIVKLAQLSWASKPVFPPGYDGGLVGLALAVAEMVAAAFGRCRERQGMG